MTQEPEHLQHNPASEMDTPKKDPVFSLHTLSKVTPISAIPLHYYIGCGIALMVIIGMVLSMLVHHKKVDNKLNEGLKTGADYNAQLAANMAAITQSSFTTPVLLPASSKPAPSVTQPANDETSQAKNQFIEEAIQQEKLQHAREWQARLNAPTNMTTATTGANLTASNSTTGNTSSSATNNVFAGNNANSSFGNQISSVMSVSATQLAHPEMTIASGELIQATLETPINSDLPGMVRAVTSQPVYAYTGNTPLIPAGSRLIGQYSSGIVQGQSRVMVIWNRVILPNGVSAQINSPGTDSLGVSGQAGDSINRHFWQQFGEATFLSILSASSATAGVSSDDEYNSASQYRTAVSDSLSQSASDTLNQNGDIKPTITIYQGAQINIFVARDVDFTGVT